MLLKKVTRYFLLKHLREIPCNRREKASLLLLLKDDGVGFNSSQPHNGNRQQKIRVRVAAIRGTVSIHSTIGKATAIVISIPILEYLSKNNGD